MYVNKECNRSKIGEKLILSAVKTDEALADLLKLEAKRLRKLVSNGTCTKDIQHSSELIRKIIYAMTITDDKIRQGIQFYKKD